MSVERIDYIGFSYNGVHSSDLGIIRTSEGSRFNENLLPTMQDKTVQVPGGDGTYFFGSYFTQRQIQVSFAFDSLTEDQVARIKSHFGDKKIHKLVFDERPYKTYYAKVTGTATMKYIPFAEGATNRVYKGEGSIQFTCYQPYAKTEQKFLTDYRTYEEVKLNRSSYEPNKYFLKSDDLYILSVGDFESGIDYFQDISNTPEWAEASGMKQNRGLYDYVHKNNTQMTLFNPGDLDADFTFTINFVGGNIAAGKISISGDNSKQLEWKRITAMGKDDAYIKINSKLNLIEGYNDQGEKTGNVYNKFIIAGTFFKIPKGRDDITMVLTDFGGTSADWQYILPYDEDADAYSPIDYTYYYF